MKSFCNLGINPYKNNLTRLKHDLNRHKKETKMEAKKRQYKYTRKDILVLEMISKGWTNPEIAQYTNESLSNTARHISQLMEKTLTVNRAHLVRWGFENNYLK